MNRAVGIFRRVATRVAVLGIGLFAVSAVVPAQGSPFVSGPERSEAKLTPSQKQEILDQIGDIINRRVYVLGVDLSKWPTFVDKHRDAIESAEDPREFTSAVNRAFREFGFSHIRLRSPSAASSRRNQDGGGALLQAVLAPQEQDIDLRRDHVRLVSEDTALIKIVSFSRSYDTRMVEGFVREASAKAKHLILDLRSNGGGATDNLRHLLSLLLPPDTIIGAFISKEDARRYAEQTGKAPEDLAKVAELKDRKYKTSKGRVDYFKGRIAVLVNRGSASASEIVAAALREQGKAPIIGSRTAGAVLASVYGRLPYGYEIQYPITDYVTAKGMRLEGNPLTPDHEVPARLGSGDAAVERAIDILENRN